MAMTVKVEGVDKLMKQLMKYNDSVAKETVNTINRGMLEVANQAKRNAKVITGRLRSSISLTKATASDPTGVTFVGVDYAPFVEFGTKSRTEVPQGLEEYASEFRTSPDGATGGVPARPFLFPAFEQERPKMIQNLENLLTKFEQ
jgi:HK97 gp10 family phage protein